MRIRGRIIEFVVLAFLAIGAGPVAAAIWNWSTTAGSNATADPSINWAEGMSPSSVNDSARAMMAVLAAWRNDISASNTSAGSGSAYTLVTSEGVDTTPATGQMLAFIAHVGNNASATLRVDGGNTYPLFLGGSAIGAASLVAGTPYRVSFNGTQWVVEGALGNPYNIPLGGLLYSTLPTPPNSNFVVPAGQCLSTTTYSSYWVALGSPASGGCAGGQFAVIDHRGRAPTALDNIGGSAANRLTNAVTGCGTAFTTMGATCANGTESKTLVTANLPAYTPAGTISNTINAGTANQNGGAIAIKRLITTIATGPGQYGGTGAGFDIGNQDMTVGSTFSGTAQGGTSQGVPSVGPNLGLYAYLRVI